MEGSIGDRRFFLNTVSFPCFSADSSTFRELTAGHETWTNIDILLSYSGQSVVHYTDNKAVVCISILGGASRQTKLKKMALEIFLTSQCISLPYVDF